MGNGLDSLLNRSSQEMKHAANDAIPVVLVVSEYITELVRLLATSLETLTRYHSKNYWTSQML